jgi:S-adenosylmethionine:tRNA ribosyltransferase-isomerase
LEGPRRRTFVVPAEPSAAEPPEARGLARDEVRLLVAGRGGVAHALFREIGRYLEPGDLVVVNTSATIAAAVDGRTDAGRVVAHFSAPAGPGEWIVELRRPDGSGPMLDGFVGERVHLPGDVTLTLLAPQAGRRLWRGRVGVEAPVELYLSLYGRPISYGYVRGRWPLSVYQTIFAREPGSAEMPSAARPFTDRLVTGLVSAGIQVAPVVLHCGVSSLEADEPPQPERFRVPEHTTRLVNETRRAGGRVVAVGTTVTRALESVARADGTVGSGSGWTDLVLEPARPARVVDGLVTGWHAADAPHLELLEAVAGPALVEEAYEVALESRYLWHEFGDSCLLLPERRSAV